MAREILTHQVLISGRITDALTGGPPRTPPEVTVVRGAGDRAVEGVVVRSHPGGRYAIHGVPQALPPAADVVLRVEVAAQGYAPAQRSIAFTSADLTRVARDVTVTGVTTRTVLVGSPARGQDVALTPLPVTLVGRVGRAEDPMVPIPGAQVRITAPETRGPVVTDADGFFTLGPAPVTTSVTLSVTAPGRTPLTRVVRLDHGSPVNQAAFALEPS